MTTPKPKARGTRRPRSGRKAGMKATLHARLFERISVTVNGGNRRCTVLEAIMLQLLQKTVAGDARARRLLLGYKEFVARAVKPRREVVFVGSQDTSTVSGRQGGSGDAGV